MADRTKIARAAEQFKQTDKTKNAPAPAEALQEETVANSEATDEAEESHLVEQRSHRKAWQVLVFLLKNSMKQPRLARKQ